MVPEKAGIDQSPDTSWITNARAKWKIAYRESLFWWAVLGGVASSPGWISLLVRLFDIDLAALPMLALQSYRDLTAQFLKRALFWTTWKPPQPLVDLLVLHIMVSGICLRADFIAKGPLFEHKQYYKESREVVHFWVGLLIPLYLPLHIIIRRIAYGDGRKAAKKRFSWIVETGASDTAKQEEWSWELSYSDRVKERYAATVKFLFLGFVVLATTSSVFFLVDVALKVASQDVT